MLMFDELVVSACASRAGDPEFSSGQRQVNVCIEARLFVHGNKCRMAFPSQE